MCTEPSLPSGASKSCRRCGADFNVPASDVFFAVYCENCLPLALAEAETQRHQSERKVLQLRWAKICPLAYRETDLSYPRLEKRFVDAVRNYKSSEGKGLGLIGPTGSGKTRLLYAVLERAFLAGMWVHSTSHNAFRKVVIDSFGSDGESRWEARSKLDMMTRVDVLLFDDLGKAPATEAVDAELFELIERRTNSKRPTLWSANGSGDALEVWLGPDRGDAILRRLVEFSTVVSALAERTSA